MRRVVRPAISVGRTLSGKWCGVALAVILMIGTLFAQQEAQNEFVPAETLQRQELPSGPLIYVAYAFAWAAVLVYVFMLWRKIGRVDRELAELRQRTK